LHRSRLEASTLSMSQKAARGAQGASSCAERSTREAGSLAIAGMPRRSKTEFCATPARPDDTEMNG
jgi:hypothetical protein